MNKPHKRLGFVIIDSYERFRCFSGWTSISTAATIFTPEAAALQMAWQHYRGNPVYALRVDNLPAKFHRTTTWSPENTEMAKGVAA